MPYSMRIPRLCLFFFMLLPAISIWCDDWEDLTAGEKMTVYGSEKSKKYPTSNLFYERENWENHYSIRAFGIYRYFDYPKFQSQTIFPFYNKVKSKMDNREKVRILNYNQKVEGNSISKNVFPFAFWGDTKGENLQAYYHSFIPLYVKNFQDDSQFQEDSFYFIPFPFYSSDLVSKNNKNSTLEETSMSLFHTKKTLSRVNNNQRIRLEFSFPFFPLFYLGTENNKNTNYLFPIYYYSQMDKKDETEQFSFLFSLFPYYKKYTISKNPEKPIREDFSISLFHSYSSQENTKTNKQSYVSYNFPFFPLYHWEKDEKTIKNHLFPIYSYKTTEEANSGEFSFMFSLFPMYYSNSKYKIHSGSEHHVTENYNLFFFSKSTQDKGGLKEPVHSSTIGFPIIPFLYYSNFEEGSGTNRRILTLYQSETNSQDELVSYSFFPFVFFKKNEYLYIPLIINKDLSQPETVSGKTSMPLLLYYKKWDINEEKTWFAVYYSRESKIVNDSFKTIFPVYWKSTSEEKEWNIFLPLYANYTDKEDSLHFNLLFLTKSKTGTLDPKISLQKKEDSWYFDSDINILYYLFKMSFRDKIEKPQFFKKISEKIKTFEEKEQEKIEQAKQEKENQDPKLINKREFTREDSNSFRGYSAIFGIFSYERADSKKHVRLLPLAWLTWNEDSDDKVFVLPFPPTVWYFGENLEYNIIFPFYGRQKDPESEKQVYMINLFWKETYKEKNWKEFSIVWPIVNQYTSDNQQGHRVLPLYLSRVTQTDKAETREFYSIFSYYKKVILTDHPDETKRTATSESFIWPILTFYNSSTSRSNPNNPDEVQKNYTVFGPIFYRTVQGESNSRTNLFLFTDWKIVNDKLDYLLIFPFYKSEDFFFLFPITFTNYKNGIQTLTLLNYFVKREDHYYYNFLFLAESEKSFKTDQYYHCLLFRSFTIENSASGFQSKGLWGFLWNANEVDTKDTEGKQQLSYWKEISFLWWLGAGYRSDTQTSIYNLSLLFIHSTNGSDYTNWTLGNYIDSNKNGFYNNFLFLAEYDANYNTQEQEYRALFRSFTWKNSITKSETQGIWGLLWNLDKRNANQQDGTTEYWKEISFLSWLGAGYRNDSQQKIYNLSFLFFHKTTPNSYTNWTLGNYTESDNFHFYQNFLFLIEYESNQQKTDWSYHFLLRSFSHKSIQQEKDSYNIKNEGLYSILWDYNSGKDKFSYDMLKGIFMDLSKTNDRWDRSTILWLGYTNETSSVTHNYFPVYYNSTEEKKFKDVYGPFLRINSVDEFERLDLGLLGIGYFYNKTFANNQEIFHIGLGSVYREFTEVQNGYRSRGSLWGFLWEYQSEEQTQFRKFSLLKLFSYTVEEDGRKKIMGIEL